MRPEVKFRLRLPQGLRICRLSLVAILLAGSCGPTESPTESKAPEKLGFEVGVAPGPEAESGFIEGRNLELKLSHAQGEMMNIPSMLQNYDGQRLDAIVTMTTSMLTAACNTVRKTPVVFTCVFDPFVTGVGESAKLAYRRGGC